MENKLATKGWQTIALWLGLVAASLYTSNSMMQIFTAIVNSLYSTVAGDFLALFSNYSLLFATVLAIVLIFFVISAWLNLVSFTFDVIDIVFEAEEEVEDSVYPASVVRWLAFSWGIFYVFFLIFPMVAG